MQKRLVVNPKIETLAGEVAEVVGVENLSQLFTILVSRYGRHLMSTWEFDPNQNQYCSAEVVTPTTTPTSSSEPLTPMSELL